MANERQRCSACGKEAACDCGVAYIAAGEFAAKVVELPENQELSNRAIAEKYGMSNQTVMRARQATAPNGAVEETAELPPTAPNGAVEETTASQTTASNEAVEETAKPEPKKRVGRDGKARKPPKPRAAKPAKAAEAKPTEAKPAAPPTNAKPHKATKAQEQAMAEDNLNGMPRPEVAKKYGVGENTVTINVAFERGRRQGVQEAQEGGTVDPSTLSKTAQEKINSAVNQIKKKLESEFESRVQTEIQRRVKEMVMPSLQEREKDADRVLKFNKGVFTILEYNAILRCLHPDMQPTVAQKSEAFQMWHESKLLLVSQKESPKEYPPLPTLAEMMAGRFKS